MITYSHKQPSMCLEVWLRKIRLNYQLVPTSVTVNMKVLTSKGFILKLVLKFCWAKPPSRISWSQPTQMISMTLRLEDPCCSSCLNPFTTSCVATRRWPSQPNPGIHHRLPVGVFLFSGFCCPIWLQEKSSVAKVYRCQFSSFRPAISPQPFFFLVMTSTVMLHCYVHSSSFMVCKCEPNLPGATILEG